MRVRADSPPPIYTPQARLLRDSFLTIFTTVQCPCNLPASIGRLWRTASSRECHSWIGVLLLLDLRCRTRAGMAVGYTKRVLREAMQGLVPDSVRLRTSKFGYISPIDYWARGALKSWLLDLCANRSFLESPIWNGPWQERRSSERSPAKRASMSVWPILNAYILEQSFKQRAQGITPSIGG